MRDEGLLLLNLIPYSINPYSVLDIRLVLLELLVLLITPRLRREEKMKKYITPRIFVEKMGDSLLIQTSTIPVNTKEPKELDSKEYFGGIDTDDADEY